MEQDQGNALVCLRATFEGHEMAVIEYAGAPCWVVRQVGDALGYAEGGLSLVRAITRDWSTELTEGIDLHRLAGAELALAKKALPGLIDKRTPSLLLLTESGVFAVALLSRAEASTRLRQWLSREVLPALRRGETPVAPSPVPQLRRLDFLQELHARGVLATPTYLREAAGLAVVGDANLQDLVVLVGQMAEELERGHRPAPTARAITHRDPEGDMPVNHRHGELLRRVRSWAATHDRFLLSEAMEGVGAPRAGKSEVLAVAKLLRSMGFMPCRLRRPSDRRARGWARGPTPARSMP